MNTYGMGLRPTSFLFNSFIAGTDFRRQNLTSIDVRFWQSKLPALKQSAQIDPRIARDI